jgi:nucleoside phosphorylase
MGAALDPWQKAEKFHQTVDFGVLTVREDELEPMARRCREKAMREFTVRGRQDYLLFDITLGTSLVYRIALVRSTRQGAGESQRRTSNMIEDFDPTWLVLVGIAGATPSGEFTLGDVVVATELHEFSVRAAVFDKGTAYRPGGGAMAPEVEDFIGLLAGRKGDLGNWNEVSTIGQPSPSVDFRRRGAFYGDTAWRKKVRKAISGHFPTPDITRKPQITARPFAGGNVLVKDDALWQQWQSHARQIEAVEMELEGMYTAARTRRRIYPILVSKGISDIVGFDRDDAWTKYACETAASGALALLELRPIEPRDKPDLVSPPAANSDLTFNLPTPQRSKPINAFVSYKWIDDKRDSWVAKFATDLRAAGVNALLDRWEVKLGESFTGYMSTKITESDVVLFVITPQSVAAVEDATSSGGALKFEMQMAAAKMVAGQGRVIGIYREGDRPPHYLKDRRYVDFRDDKKYPERLRELISDLNGVDARPPLGTTSHSDATPVKEYVRPSLGKDAQRGKTPVKRIFRGVKRKLSKRDQEIEELQQRYDEVASEWYDANMSHMTSDDELDMSDRIKMFREVMDALETRLSQLGKTPRSVFFTRK